MRFEVVITVKVDAKDEAEAEQKAFRALFDPDGEDSACVYYAIDAEGE